MRMDVSNDANKAAYIAMHVPSVGLNDFPTLTPLLVYHLVIARAYILRIIPAGPQRVL